MMCKECHQEPRQFGSSRCKKCSDRYRRQQWEQERLNKKIKLQVEINSK